MKVNVTDNFIKYSKELAEDILGYNQCYGGDANVKKKLKEHIKKCNKYLSNDNIVIK